MFSTTFSSSINFKSWQQTASSLFQSVIKPLTATSASNPSRHYEDKLSKMEEGNGPLPDTKIDIRPETYVPTHAAHYPTSREQITNAYLVIDVAPKITAPPERPQVSAPAVYGDDNV